MIQWDFGGFFRGRKTLDWVNGSVGKSEHRFHHVDFPLKTLSNWKSYSKLQLRYMLIQWKIKCNYTSVYFIHSYSLYPIHEFSGTIDIYDFMYVNESIQMNIKIQWVYPHVSTIGCHRWYSYVFHAGSTLHVDRDGGHHLVDDE